MAIGVWAKLQPRLIQSDKSMEGGCEPALPDKISKQHINGRQCVVKMRTLPRLEALEQCDAGYVEGA